MNEQITYDGLIRDLKASQSVYSSLGILRLMSKIFCDSGASITLILVEEFYLKYNTMQTPKMIFEKYINLTENKNTNFYAVINGQVILTNSNSPKSFYAKSMEEAVEFCKQNKIF
jgi:hypothetical protein